MGVLSAVKDWDSALHSAKPLRRPLFCLLPGSFALSPYLMSPAKWLESMTDTENSSILPIEAIFAEVTFLLF